MIHSPFGSPNPTTALTRTTGRALLSYSPDTAVEHRKPQVDDTSSNKRALVPVSTALSTLDRYLERRKVHGGRQNREDRNAALSMVSGMCNCPASKEQRANVTATKM